MAKQTKKPLTQEQHDFVVKFITKKKPKEAQKQEEKLTGEYQDFLRRKDKVLADIYRFPPEHPRRKELEAELAQVDQLQTKDDKANFKKAYEKLEKVKERIHKAAKNMPPLSADKLGRDVQMLARMVQNVATAAAELFSGAQAVCDEVRNHPKTSSFATLNEKLDYRDAFEAVEDGLRTKMAALTGARDNLIKSLNALELDKKEQEIRNQIAFVEEATPGSTTAVAGRLDQVVAALKVQGRPLTAAVLTAGLAQKEAALDQLLAEWKDLGGQQRDSQPMPDKFKKLEERDRRRVNAAKMLLNREGQWDEKQLGRTQEPPKKVDTPYSWESCPQFGDLSDSLPGSDAEVTPNKIRECRDKARQLVKDALTANANDPDFVFDLSIQTKPSLVAMLESQMGLDAAYRPDAALVQEISRLKQAGELTGRNVYLRALNTHVGDKKNFQNSRDVAQYEKQTKGLIDSLDKRIAEFQADGSAPAMLADLTNLRTALRNDLAALPKERFKLVQEMADEMAGAIVSECPNKTSQESQEFDIPMPQGGTEKFNAPQKITLNGSEYAVKKCLGAGAYGVAFSYQDANGKTLVIKSFKETDGEKLAGITRELKMHRHLMTGDDGDGKENVLRLDGVMRSPDGGIHMVLEHADGGGMDRLGDSLRALGKGGLLSQEAQNAVNRHLILQAVQGLKYMQGRNMTHHDIKADNFFLTSDGTVKLADFGSSQVSDNPEGEVSTKGVEGAVAFRSPEFYDMEPTITGKADTYTLGTMIAKLTSPTNSSEKLKLVSVGHVDYSPDRKITALDRMLKAMMDPDPTKRPRLEAVEYSAYLADGGGHDPEQVQALIKASVAYSLKAGKEVGKFQEEVDSLNGAIVAGDTWSAVEPDDKLNQALQGGDAAAAVRSALRDSVNALAEVVTRMEQGQDKITILRAYAGPALQAVRNAERLCQLGNVTDQNLLQQVSEQMRAARLQYEKVVAGLRDAVGVEQLKIDAVNKRNDVAPLLENLKKAQDALLRGPDETKTTPPDPNQTPQQAIEQRKAKLKALVEKHNLDNAYLNGLNMVEVAVRGGMLDRADKILTELEKRAGNIDEGNRVVARTRGLLERLKTAGVGPNDDTELKKHLSGAVAHAKNGEFSKADELLNVVERFLRNLEMKDQLPPRPQQTTPESVGRGPST